MGRASKTRRLAVWMNGELVGYWTLGPNGLHEFGYVESWLVSPAARPLSLSMPLQPADASYHDKRVEAFFDNLLPENPSIRRRIQSRFGTVSTSAFELLSQIGRDCVGAIQLLPPNIPPGNIGTIKGTRLSDARIASMLRTTASGPGPGRPQSDDFRISLAGMQEKTALLLHKGRWYIPSGATPTTHIFKLPLGKVGNQGADLSTSPENEWLCSEILRAYGFASAPSRLAQFEDQRVLIVERFDRRLSKDGDWWLRLPQEDLCQATATPPDLKYEADGGPGIRIIMDFLLAARDSTADRSRFYQIQILFWMLCATDGHAKNFSLFIEPRGTFSLTPFYDVLSAYPILGRGPAKLAPEKARMAMAILGEKKHYHWSRILPRHWFRMGHACGLPPNIIQALIADLVDRTPAVIAKVNSLLPKGFPISVSEPILKGLKKAAKQLEGAG